MSWGSTGCDVKTAKQTASTILFSRAGAATVRQIETVETKEVRGLNETAGLSKVPNAANVDDQTVQTIYYAFIDGLVFTITVMTGTKTEWSSARKDESGQWVATCRVYTYAPKGLNTSVWKTTPINSDGQVITLSANGVSRTVSRDKSTAFAFNFSGMILCTTIETKVTEYKYINSEANATAKVNANNQAAGHSSVTTQVSSAQGTAPAPYASFVIPYGTEKFASSRYVSPNEGWSVTVTEKIYGFSGNGWHL